MSAEIERLMTRYCDLMDTGDFAGVGELFTNGALVDPDGHDIARGARAVTAFYADLVILYDGSPRTKHRVFDIEVSGDIVQSSYVVWQDGVAIIAGRYVDRIENGRFVERRFFVDLAGDLSKHLRGRGSIAPG